jgi:hypothetical protein
MKYLIIIAVLFVFASCRSLKNQHNHQCDKDHVSHTCEDRKCEYVKPVVGKRRLTGLGTH